MPGHGAYIELSDFSAEHEKATDDVHTDPSQATGQKPWYRRRGWRLNITIGIALISIVLVTNCVLLALSIKLPVDVDGSRANGILFRGSCTKAERVSQYWHLLVNALGTTLLSVSNVALQLASSPTRDQIDDAHKHRKWLHVGIFSMRNLRFMPWKRRVCSLILVLSSVPFHLVYNATIFVSIAAYDYSPLVVSEDFLSGQPWFLGRNDDTRDSAHLSTPVPFYPDAQGSCSAARFSETLDHIADMQYKLSTQPSEFVNFTKGECIDVFAKTQVSDYRALILVGHNSSTSEVVYSSLELSWVYANEWSGYGPQSNWVQATTSWYYGYQDSHDPKFQQTWTLPMTEQCMLPNSQDGNSEQVAVSYCLALPAPELCTVAINTTFMGLAVICNILKVVCLTSLLWWKQFHPLTTVGDAIANFLQREDLTTRGEGPLSYRDIRQGRWKSSQQARRLAQYTSPSGRYWNAHSRRWLSTVSVTRRLVLTVLLAPTLVLGLLFSLGLNTNFWRLQSPSLGAPRESTQSKNLETTLVLASLPQLGISVLYFAYNGMLASMYVNHEFVGFALQRKALRTSAPRGEQVDTFWLSLPFKYILPFMGIFTLIHFFASESLFMVRILEYGANARFLRNAVTGVGSGTAAIFWTTVLALIAYVYVFSLGVRKYPRGAPIVGSCSAAISAACHRAYFEEGPEIVEKQLMYGVLRTEEVDGKRITGFSAQEVDPLIYGEMYG